MKPFLQQSASPTIRRAGILLTILLFTALCCLPGLARTGTRAKSASKAPDVNIAEKVFEVFWRHKIFERFSLTPDLQIVIHPLGKADSPTQVITTLRAFYEF